MVTAIVRVQLSDEVTLESATATFEATASDYLDRDGLVRKYYLFDPQTRVGGGCYLMADRTAAEQLFGEAWSRNVEAQYGSRPEVSIFETPVIVDNQAGSIDHGRAER